MCDDPNRCENLAWKGLRSRGQAVSMTLMMCHIIVLKLTNKDTAKRPLLAPLLEIFTSFPCIRSHCYSAMPVATSADQAFRQATTIFTSPIISRLVLGSAEWLAYRLMHPGTGPRGPLLSWGFQPLRQHLLPLALDCL